MGRLGRATYTIHLISAPQQPGGKRMYHYIREAKRLLSSYIYYAFGGTSNISSINFVWNYGGFIHHNFKKLQHICTVFQIQQHWGVFMNNTAFWQNVNIQNLRLLYQLWRYLQSYFNWTMIGMNGNRNVNFGFRFRSKPNKMVMVAWKKNSWKRNKSLVLTNLS